MKNALASSILMLFFFGCSTPTASDKVDFPTGSTQVSSNSVEASPKLPDPRFLTIQGNDIWVREDDGPKGEVIMKLNEGDRCEVLGNGSLEMIRGTVDCWYEIVAKGDTGWVFGSQTDHKLSPLGEGVTPMEAWGNYRQRRSLECQKYFDEYYRLDSVRGRKCEFENHSNGDFRVHGRCFDAKYDSTYHFGVDTVGPIWMLNISTQSFRGRLPACEGGAALFGTHKEGLWQLHSILPGKYFGHFRLENDSTLFIFHHNDYCSFPNSFSIFLGNSKANSFRGFGWFSVGSGENYDAKGNRLPGNIVTDVKLARSGPLPQLVIQLSRSGDTTLTWNPQKNFFVGE